MATLAWVCEDCGNNFTTERMAEICESKHCEKGNRYTTKGIYTEQHTGHDNLWLWFSLDYASWLTLPRVLMHEMPDEWQDKMSDLLNEWDETWDTSGIDYKFTVSMKEHNGRFIKMPDWLCNYRYPKRDVIESIRKKGQ